MATDVSQLAAIMTAIMILFSISSLFVEKISAPFLKLILKKCIHGLE